MRNFSRCFNKVTLAATLRLFEGTVPPFELGKQATLHLRTVAPGVEDGDRKRSSGIALNTRMSSSF